MKSLFIPEEVAEVLQGSLNEFQERLGGFFPADIKAL
jgi:hypothetical protein